MKWIIIILLGLAILSAGSCSKENSDTKQTISFCSDGYIIFGGPRESDGLGWYFSPATETGIYPLEVIADSLKTDSLFVNACLQNTGRKLTCQCPDPLDLYVFVSVDRK